ncbi:hypothetical protein SAMD00023353_0802060 [Rosellinia necatrix]|uniref:Ribonuclease H1 N-terminal domain-containing protein n=1 Tax=Rosellinia necatrix TaxID=77044 RepID=A0A1W2TB71_ROSNE|nr:hypothetical protein SAMD00023353_0802060 [Rosellinia necatrix]
MAKKYYGVRKGRVCGVYTDWARYKAQVEKCANESRGFDTRDEAEFYVATGRTRGGSDGDALFAQWKRRARQQPSPPPSVVVKSEQRQPPRIKVEAAFDASQSYFSQVPDFKPDDKADFDDEFGRFASSQNIERGSQAWRRTRTDAIRHEMVFHYSHEDIKREIKGEDTDDRSLPIEKQCETTKLQVFQNMCREVGLEPLNTADGCAANLKSVLVNIIDYIDAKRVGRPVRVWGPHEFEEFRRYTLSDEKRIDLPTARANGGFLIPLLQVLRSENAASVYRENRYRAETARERHARCAWRRGSGRNAKRSLSMVKEEVRTPPESPWRERDLVSPARWPESDRSSSPQPFKESDYSSSPQPIKRSNYSPSPQPVKESDYSSSSPQYIKEPDYSPSPQPVKEEMAETDPWDTESIGSSVIEILDNIIQTGTKRAFIDLTQGDEDEDITQDGVTSSNPYKRARL